MKAVEMEVWFTVRVDVPDDEELAHELLREMVDESTLSMDEVDGLEGLDVSCGKGFEARFAGGMDLLIAEGVVMVDGEWVEV